jgi:hypothetical protein
VHCPRIARMVARITASAVKNYPAGVPPMGSWPLSQGRLAAAKAPVHRGAHRWRSWGTAQRGFVIKISNECRLGGNQFESINRSHQRWGRKTIGALK